MGYYPPEGIGFLECISGSFVRIIFDWEITMKNILKYVFLSLAMIALLAGPSST